MVTTSQIQSVADRIAREFDPDRIILFGSLADGRETADSDVDLLVVLPHQEKNWRVAARIRSRIVAGFPLDLLVRTPQEMTARIAEGDPFLSEIDRSGKLLYEKHRPSMV